MMCILKRLLLLCSCLLGHITLSSGNTLYGRQQDPVEVHWYNTRDSVFELHSVAQLRGFAELVNSGIDFHKQEVRLANDIFLNDTTGWKDWEQNPPSGDAQWMPIGKEDRPFCGTFDGQGHTVYGLYISRGMESYYQGLFGLVLNGRIRNVQVMASYLRAHDHVGGIAGMIGYKSEISGCTFGGTIRGAGHMIGGIVGKAEEYNRIINCANLGDIYGQRRVGGITGSFMWGSFYNCSNQGDVRGRHERVGGIVGALLDGALYDLRRLEEGYELDRGIVRDVEKRADRLRSTQDTFANNYNTGGITGEDMIGGIAGSFADVGKSIIDTASSGGDSFAIDEAEIGTSSGELDYSEEGITDRNTPIDSLLRFFRISMRKGTYFANCYNAGKLSGQYPVHVDGLIGHYGWNWRRSVYLLDRRGDSCYWSDSLHGGRKIGSTAIAQKHA
ncbi:MAG TPA: hypothetical protein VKZ57_00810 [Sphingobacterium sp.]|nr:hypothetical protein [Sphingobacterium sp.]